MIPSFLRSLAALLRRLISEGRSVHCTEADAAELEMLAGLFEQHGLVRYRQEGTLTIPAGALKAGDIVLIEGRFGDAEVTPADVAFGWLRLARAPTEHNEQRCVHGRGAKEEDVRRSAVCAELALLAAAMDAPLEADHMCDPYQGTIEGARAVWSFMAQNLGIGMSVDKAVRSGAIEMADKYRRELEAMR